MVAEQMTGTRVIRRDQLDGAPAFTEIGTTGLVAFGGYVQEEWLPALRWPQATKIWREMSDNDPIVGAMLNTGDLLMRKVDWRTDPADDSPLAPEIADHCHNCLSDMTDSWPDTLSSMLTMLPFGFSVHDMVAKRRAGRRAEDPSRFDDGKVGWLNLSIRAQETLYDWIYDERDRLVGVNQRTMTGGGAPIPLAKCVHVRTSALKANPQGRSVLRNAYRPWFYKRRIEEIEAVGIERDLAGLPIAYAPSDIILSEDSDKLKIRDNFIETVKNVRRNEAEGLLWPSEKDAHGNRLYEFALLSTGGRRQFDTGAVVTRYDQRILTTMLADFILLGHEGVGTLGVEFGASKVDLFNAGLDAWLAQSAAEMTRGYEWLVDLNGWPLELTPTLLPGKTEKIDMVAIAETVGKLADAGAPIFPDAILLDHLLDQLNLPHTEPDEL